MSEDLSKSGRRSCFLICVSLLVLFGTVLGFIAGLLVGGLVAKHGHFVNLNNQGDAAAFDGIFRDVSSNNNCEENGFSFQNKTLNACSVCSDARLVVVSGASYADCDGVYTMTN